MKKNYRLKNLHRSFLLSALSVFAFLTFSVSSSAQVFWTETFSNGCTANCDAATYSGPNGAWSVTTVSAGGASANKWFVSCAEDGNAAGACGSGCSSNDPSLHLGSLANLFCPGGDCGAAYNATGAANVTDLRAESPIINCSGQTGITLDFVYIGKGQTCVTDFCDLQISTNGGGTWSNLQTCMTASTCGSGQGLWTAFSIALPAAANNNPNVKIGFHWKNNGDGAGSDPSFAVDDITLSTTTSNTITTGTVSGSPFCACSTVNVPFTSTGTFNAGNIYTAQLSDATGSFAAPTSIGTLASTANSGTITCTIPCGTPSGTLYRIRVISSNPAITGTDNGVNITINAVVTPSVSIAASSTTICTGSSVTFTATPTNGGTTPGYQWQVNGSNVGGATSSTFTTTTLNNGDVVTVIMTSTAPCPSPATATSNSITITVVSSLTPSVSIAASPGSTICSGTPVTFTATPTNGGTTPTYQWQINGTNVGGATSSTYTSSTLNNGDVVTVIMTSNDPCASPTTATSNSITITVTTSLTPSVSITASPGSTICSGTSVTFTATPTNGGTTPTYQWQVNGTNVGGATSSTYNTTTLNNGDVVTVIMTSNDPCASPATATSNSITMTVSTSLTPSVSIAASPAPPICSGQSVTFTATPTNGGTTPTYQWQVNGTNVGGATSSTYTSSTLNNGDVVTVIMTSNDPCASPTTATSNSITITIQSSVTPSVSITATTTTPCNGTAVTFTATPSGGGTSPSYQWQVNGSNVGTNSATYSSVMNTGDVVTVTMTSNSPCASPTTATSNSITITVQNCNPPTANFSGTPTVMCQPGCVNFTDLSTNSPTSWQWSFPGASTTSSTSQNPTNICYSANGSYTVTLIVSNADGSDTLTQVGYITVGSPVTVTISGNTLINACEQTVLSASPTDGTYQWGPNVNILCENCQSVTVSPPQTQQYWVTYTSPDGCTDSDTTTVTVTDIYTYFMPTGFSPNGDGINDTLLVRGRGIDYISLKIFDRIGEKVFESDNIDKGWDGRLHGIPMDNGVFVYTLEVQFCNGDNTKEKGNVTLVR